MAGAKVDTGMQQESGNLRLIKVDTYDGICVWKEIRIGKGPYERSTED
jgi:hypothetical protein